MYDLADVLNSIEPPNGCMVFWVENNSIELTKARGRRLEFYPLSPEERRDSAKREARIGRLYVNPEGHVQCGSLVAMIMAIEDYEEQDKWIRDRAADRVGQLGRGAALAGQTDGHAEVLVDSYLKTSRAPGNPFDTKDSAPRGFRKDTYAATE